MPGWPYSFVAALESGRTSWVALLGAVGLGPEDDATAVTAAQLRDVVERLTQAGHWKPGDPEILIVMDAGYDVTNLSHVLADLPVVLLGRLRSDRVMLRDPGPARSGPKGGRPRRHGGVLTFAKPDTWHQPDVTTTTDTTRYGTAQTMGPQHPPRTNARGEVAGEPFQDLSHTQAASVPARTDPADSPTVSLALAGVLDRRGPDTTTTLHRLAAAGRRRAVGHDGSGFALEAPLYSGLPLSSTRRSEAVTTRAVRPIGNTRHGNSPRRTRS